MNVKPKFAKPTKPGSLKPSPIAKYVPVKPNAAKPVPVKPSPIAKSLPVKPLLAKPAPLKPKFVVNNNQETDAIESVASKAFSEIAGKRVSANSIISKTQKGKVYKLKDNEDAQPLPKVKEVDCDLPYTIYLEDNILKVLKSLDLNDLDLEFHETFDEKSIKYSHATCSKLCLSELRFTVQGNGGNPFPKLLVSSGVDLYSPKYMEPILDVKIIREGKVRFTRLTYSQILEELSKGWEVRQVHGNLTAEQIQELQLLERSGNFKFYEV